MTFQLPELHAIRMSILVRWEAPQRIPEPVVANVLRGGLALTFRHLVCPREWMEHECPPCPLYRGCPYGQVFAPTPPPGSPQLSREQDTVRPFVIEPPMAVPEGDENDATMRFGLLIVGRAMDQLPLFLTTIERLGEAGLGRDRVPFRVERVIAEHPRGDEVVREAGSQTVRLPSRRITDADLVETPIRQLGIVRDHRAATMASAAYETPRPMPAAALNASVSPQPRILVRFLTPTLLRSGSYVNAQGRYVRGREMRESPPFGVLIRRLRDRLSQLSLFFGTPWRGVDFAGIGTRADDVVLIDSRTQWLTRRRHSTRTGQSHEISGLVGDAIYEFPTRETWDAYRPLLAAGMLVHVGKSAPWGNGAIDVALLEDSDS